MRNKKFALIHLVCRYADGSANPPPTDPSPADPPKTDTDLPKDPPKQTDPKPKEPDLPAKTYTDADLESAKQQAVEDYKKHLEEAKDFEKMTDSEKVTYLQKQMEEEKLSKYATEKLGVEKLPVEAAAWIKGANEKVIDENIKAFKAMYDKGVQDGVMARLLKDGYNPHRSGAGALGSAETKARPRGVKIE